MKLAASNLALPAFDHLHHLPALRALGLEGLELAPHHSWREISPACIEATRKTAEASGLAIVGLHALLRDRPDLGLLKDTEARRRSADYLVEMSSVCRDLGGRTLILDAQGRHGIPDRMAWQQCRALLDELLPRIEAHGTVLCLAPQGAEAGDFCATAKECYLLVNAVDHPSFGFHLGAAGLAATGEMGHATFAAIRGRLESFHADEPGLAPLGASGAVDHADLRRHLAAISYFDWVTVVQQAPLAGDPVAALAEGVRFVADHYLPIDTR